MSLRADAIAIWNAGVAAVKSESLVQRQLQVSDKHLTIAGHSFELAQLRRLEVVGAGKAGAGMAIGVERALSALPDSVARSGFVNVPSDCVRPTQWIQLHSARPPGINEPTPAGVAGTSEILQRVQSLTEGDLCIVLLSGGGSALLCAPVPAITLDDKVAVTRLLAGDGASIHELNAVRTQLSLVKGGGLLRHCNAGSLLTLIISDVVGDPLDIIASGPTVPSGRTRADAVQILRHRGIWSDRLPARVREYLEDASADAESSPSPPSLVENCIVGSNTIALQAAAERARELGYAVEDLGSDHEGEARTEGQSLFQRLQAARSDTSRKQRLCVLSGGEPTVRLAETTAARKGGRNQELVLSAVAHQPKPELWRNLALLSGGTDGEDGPTDAAGAVADEPLLQAMQSSGIDPDPYLAINNSYPFFDRLGGLLTTGPTHTNVMDLRV
jgi:glycerate 2-kinase